eukprot:Polyplicarium_translucidae@DN3308_c2_g1_i24.p2
MYSAVSTQSTWGDEEDHCQDDAFKGEESATCGVTENDPCHLVATYDDGSNASPTAPGDCGKCVKMTYKAGGAGDDVVVEPYLFSARPTVEAKQKITESILRYVAASSRSPRRNPPLTPPMRDFSSPAVLF